MSFTRRRLLSRGFALTTVAASLGAGGFSALAQSPGPDLSRVHPELRAMAAAIARRDAVTPRLSAASLAQARERMSIVAPPLASIPCEKRAVQGSRGQPDVTVYLINASPGSRRPAIVHTHGGGFVTGSARMAIAGMQILARQLDCVIVTVEYRLAPETTWAGSVEDNYAALKWLYSNAVALGVDPARIAVMGESAGGGHAALLALTARDRGEVPLAFQYLTYPMLDDRTGTSRHVLPRRNIDVDGAGQPICMGGFFGNGARWHESACPGGASAGFQPGRPAASVHRRGGARSLRRRRHRLCAPPERRWSFNRTDRCSGSIPRLRRVAGANIAVVYSGTP